MIVSADIAKEADNVHLTEWIGKKSCSMQQLFLHKKTTRSRVVKDEIEKENKKCMEKAEPRDAFLQDPMGEWLILR